MLALAVLAMPASSQVTINASIDSLQLLIGEQAHVKLEVSCPADGQLIMPTYPNNHLMDGIEIVGWRHHLLNTITCILLLKK